MSVKQPSCVVSESNVKTGFEKFVIAMSDARICVFVTFSLSLAIAVVLAFVLNPLPKVHDEFSYLLAADAFSQLKTSAETHPFWHHFESFHIIHHPRYASKYPPGQGLVLAIGKLLGHPIVGSCMTTAFSLATVMWALLGLIDKRDRWLAAILIATHPGIQIHWGQSYWSGCLALGSSALLAGCLLRISSAAEIKYSILAGLGTIGLMTTRPFEGCILAATVGLVLIYQLTVNKTWNLNQFLLRILLPGLMVTTLGFLLLLCYNKSVTGHYSKFPYQIHEQQYSWNQVFFWQAPKADKPEYRHSMMAKFFETDAREKLENYAGLGSGIAHKLEFAVKLQFLLFGGTFLFGVLGIVSVVRRHSILIILAGPPLLAAFLTAWNNTHYAAPAAAPLLMLILCSLMVMKNKLTEKPATKQLFLIAIFAVHIAWMGKEFFFVRQTAAGNWWVSRNQIVQELKARPGKDLVIVRYGSNHIPHQEWVYNEFDIDRSEVVWARELAADQNRALINFFGERNAWLLEPDSKNRLLKPYPKDALVLDIR